MKFCLRILMGFFLTTSTAVSLTAADQLPSWNDGASKQSIVRFVEKVTTTGAPDFVPVADRIAVFDNDGTLWSEQPMYVQMVFAIDRVKAMAGQHPEWQEKQPFKSILSGDLKGLAESGQKGIAELIMATHAGTTTEEFEQIVLDWIKTARHPKYQRLYTDCVYQPMLELQSYLRDHGFKIYIVSGGGIDFMRPWTERVYGVPRQQVIGTSFKLKYEVQNGKPVLIRLPEIDLVDDKAGKPVGIQRMIGQRPLMAFGNSDGDFEMLEWTTSGSGPRFGLILHHTDDLREVAYDRDSPFGRLAKGLEEGPRRGWTIVDMKRDWNAVFPARP